MTKKKENGKNSYHGGISSSTGCAAAVADLGGDGVTSSSEEKVASLRRSMKGCAPCFIGCFSPRPAAGSHGGRLVGRDAMATRSTAVTGVAWVATTDTGVAGVPTRGKPVVGGSAIKLRWWRTFFFGAASSDGGVGVA